MDWFDIIASAEDKPYKLGEHDCLRLACAVVEARTGIDYWPRFKGYKTKRQALAVIARHADNLRDAITKTLGTDELPPLFAQRGDLVIYRDSEEHIGICVGEQVVVLGENGLVHIPITSPLIKATWRVKCQHQ